MKAYKVNVNGNLYEITLEIIDKKDIGTTPVSAAPAPAPAAPTPAPAAPAQTGSTTISAPMPGTILKVNVANGQAVKKGDVLMILEAMKLENEITSPIDGTVASVNIQTGATVETGTLLCTLA
ncbi:MAG: acetyl-CoA carboxylase biotin carboxyl carrier protein subunit [Ruminococcaceae bacterium]|nr:acetyl-CoA carboxylase biotin carboxyl carrier protein subunit [Oscillospiraceae bacterium]